MPTNLDNLSAGERHHLRYWTAFCEYMARHSSFVERVEPELGAIADIQQLYVSELINEKSCIPMQTLAPQLREVVMKNKCDAFGLV